MTGPLPKCKVHNVAHPYQLGSILNQPIGHSVTELIQVGGQPVTVTTNNYDDFVGLNLTGNVKLAESCARCGEPVTLNLPINADFRIKAEPSETEIEDGVIELDRHAAVDLEQLVAEATELARPILAYCSKHQTASPKPFVIE